MIKFKEDNLIESIDIDEEVYQCFNCGSEVIKEDVSLGYCIMCKYEDDAKSDRGGETKND
jgi:hypothetical protein